MLHLISLVTVFEAVDADELALVAWKAIFDESGAGVVSPVSWGLHPASLTSDIVNREYFCTTVS